MWRITCVCCSIFLFVLFGWCTLSWLSEPDLHTFLSTFLSFAWAIAFFLEAASPVHK